MENTLLSRSSKVLKWSLIIGIVIVLNLFYNYALSLAFPAPEYNDFCPQKQVTLAIPTQEQCVASGGAWTEYPKPTKVDEPVGYCDESYACRQNVDAAQKSYDRNVFISLVVLGVLTFVASLLLMKFDVASIALSIGAVLDFVIASLRYWGRADNLVKVFILGVALAVLFWIAIKKFNSLSANDETKK